MDKIFFARLNDTVILPSKSTENAGYDIYANFELDYITIEPGKVCMVPTGLISCCSEDYYFQLQERGSTGTKNISQRCGVIDSGYRGEWFIPITNLNKVPLVIGKRYCDKNKLNFAHIFYPYEKAICQAVLLPVPKVEVFELSVENIMKIASIRGEGKLGSSSK